MNETIRDNARNEIKRVFKKLRIPIDSIHFDYMNSSYISFDVYTKGALYSELEKIQGSGWKINHINPSDDYKVVINLYKRKEGVET